MRRARFFLAALTALAVGGCMSTQQQTYYVVDPQNGQMVPVVQQQQQFAQSPQYAQVYPTPGAAATLLPPAPQASSRGLYSTSPAYAQQQYAPQTQYAPQPQYAAPVYQPPKQTRSAPTGPNAGRGFFTSGRTTRAPVYAQQPQMVQPQVMQAPPIVQQQAPYVAQYTPPVAVQQAAPMAAYASAPANYQADYTLDSGDKLRVVVFGQDGITNSYMVDAGGNISLPLIGPVPARGNTTQNLSRTIAAKLKQGFVRDPSVSVEIEAYRPFFILGEVTTPGQYPYVANMTAETAIAIAGGFAPRASKSKVQVTRNAPGQHFNGEVPLNFPLRPGDSVVVKERWF